MATTPATLSGATAVLKIDGTDMHSFGMIVNNYSNPVPKAKSSSISIPGMSGDYDYAKFYEPRFITLNGAIIADSNSHLLSNLDDLKEWLRLRENQDSMQLILQNQTDRYWTVRYDGQFTLDSMGKWYNEREVRFSLSLKCLKPFAEKTTITTATGTCNVAAIKAITYSGNIPAPLNVEIKAHENHNLLDGVSEATTGWTAFNCTLSVDTNYKIYGTNGIKMSNIDVGFYMYRDIFSLITAGKYYVASFFATIPTETPSCCIKIITDDSGGQTFTGNTILDVYEVGRSFVKLDGDDFHTNGTYAYFQVYGGTGTAIYIDGICLHEITAAEYADADYVPIAYTDGGAAVSLRDLSIRTLGKNLCRAGQEDNDVDNWNLNWNYAGNVYDLAEDAIVLEFLMSNADSDLFKIPSGTYKISFRYISDAGDVARIYGQIRSETGGAYWSDNNSFLNLTEDGTWRNGEISFVVPVGYYWIKLLLISSYSTIRKKIRNIQIETGSTATAFEKFRENNFTWVGTLDVNDRLIIDSDAFTTKKLDVSARTLTTAIATQSGDFLKLYPGTNNILLEDGRQGEASPETYSSGKFEYILSYRERYM